MRLGGAELWASSVSSAPQGLRFSGINDTDFRVYLLGNPVSAPRTALWALSCARGELLLSLTLLFSFPCRWFGG